MQNVSNVIKNKKFLLLAGVLIVGVVGILTGSGWLNFTNNNILPRISTIDNKVVDDYRVESNNPQPAVVGLGDLSAPVRLVELKSGATMSANESSFSLAQFTGTLSEDFDSYGGELVASPWDSENVPGEIRLAASPISSGPPEICGDSICSSPMEDSLSCPEDCGGVCGDGMCAGAPDEDSYSCPEDCGPVSGCGDGVCRPPETIATCSADCRSAVCGDRMIGPGEQCDDGNTYAGDGCSSTCQLETGCPGGTWQCPSGCLDLMNDNNNCGSCGNKCVGGEVCNEGVCTGPLVCPTCYANCNTDPSDGCEVNTCNNNYHCGNCASVCQSGMICEDSQCVVGGTGCLPGLTSCNGSCVNFVSDNNNCGTCGNKCVSGQTCQNATCVSDPSLCQSNSDCTPGSPFCNLSTGKCVGCLSSANCLPGYTCNIALGQCVGGGVVCGNGSCEPTETSASCPQDCGGLPVCGDGSCQAPYEDSYSCPSDCGAPVVCGDGTCNPAYEDEYSCPSDCNAPYVCGDGACTMPYENQYSCPQDCSVSCSGGLLMCPSGCVNTQNDSKNCGSCGNVCDSGKVCLNSTCSCAAGMTQCGNSCSNIQSDINNCGMCGNKCRSGESCLSGRCAAVTECGNLVCEAGEDFWTCPGDCNCGDLFCDAYFGEDCNTCSEDCGSCSPLAGFSSKKSVLAAFDYDPSDMALLLNSGMLKEMTDRMGVTARIIYPDQGNFEITSLFFVDPSIGFDSEILAGVKIPSSGGEKAIRWSHSRGLYYASCDGNGACSYSSSAPFPLVENVWVKTKMVFADGMVMVYVVQGNSGNTKASVLANNNYTLVLEELMDPSNPSVSTVGGNFSPFFQIGSTYTAGSPGPEYAPSGIVYFDNLGCTATPASNTYLLKAPPVTYNGTVYNDLSNYQINYGSLFVGAPSVDGKGGMALPAYVQFDASKRLFATAVTMMANIPSKGIGPLRLTAYSQEGSGADYGLGHSYSYAEKLKCGSKFGVIDYLVDASTLSAEPGANYSFLPQPFGGVFNLPLGSTESSASNGSWLLNVSSPFTEGDHSLYVAESYQCSAKLSDLYVYNYNPIRDEDSDGVTDDIDKCSGTPAGSTVDEVGCRKIDVDTDDDGHCNQEVTFATTWCSGIDMCPAVAGFSAPTEYVLKVVSFESTATGITAPKVYAGNTQITIGGDGKYHIPLFDIDGNQIVDNTNYDTLPKGVWVVDRQAGNGPVDNKCKGKNKCKWDGIIQAGLKGDGVGANKYVYYKTEATLNGAFGVHNSAKNAFEKQGDGSFVKGDPGKDEFTVNGLTIFADSTVRPASDYYVVEYADLQGCPFGDKTIVTKHIVDQKKSGICGKLPNGNNRQSCEQPVAGVTVKVFDREDPDFISAFSKRPKKSLFDNVFESNIGIVGTCETNSNGACLAPEAKPGKFLVIAKLVNATNNTATYNGKNKNFKGSVIAEFSDEDDDEDIDSIAFSDRIKVKQIRFLETIKSNGSTGHQTCDRTVLTGSSLTIDAADYTLWNSNEELYPYIFKTDSDWSLDVCMQVPTGYNIAGVLDGDGNVVGTSECIQTVLANEEKVLLFRIVETGSPEPDTTFTFTSTHKNGFTGKVEKVKHVSKIQGLRKAAKDAMNKVVKEKTTKLVESWRGKAEKIMDVSKKAQQAIQKTEQKAKKKGNK